MNHSLRKVRLDIARLFIFVFSLIPGVTSGASEFELDLNALQEIAPPPGSIIGLDNIEQFEQLIDPEFADLIKKGGLLSKRTRLYLLNPMPII